MIPSITPFTGPPGGGSANHSLNNDQTDKLSAVLANYDAKGLSGEAASKVVTETKEVGVGANQTGGSGGPPHGAHGPVGAGPGGPGGGGAASVDPAVKSLFEDAASLYEADETGQTFVEIIAQRLESEGMTYNQPLVDFRA